MELIDPKKDIVSLENLPPHSVIHTVNSQGVHRQIDTHTKFAMKQIGLLKFALNYRNFEIWEDKVHFRLQPPDSSFFDINCLPSAQKLYYFNSNVFFHV